MRTRSSHCKKPQPVSLDPSLDAQKQSFLSELGEAISLEDNTLICSLYHHLAPEPAITTFLKKSRLYSWTQCRWKLPRTYAKLLDNDLYTPFVKVLASILKQFKQDSTPQGTREVVDTHATDLLHDETDSVAHHARPSLVIKAEGPSFELPHTNSGGKAIKIGYSNIAACIDIQVEGRELTISDQMLRAAIYARQLFINQPNRRFVRVLVLTQQHLRLFHFDRSGVQYTPYLNFHDDPYTFVRLVLGLSSPDEFDIGLDASIQWTIVDGLKASGTLRTHSANDLDVVYQLAKTEPLFLRGSIRGRSTTCWSVRDPVTDEELIVKDSWRSSERSSEHIYLQDGVGIRGVVQLVSSEANRCETKNLRCFGDSVPPSFHNRIDTRTVMKACGQPIKKFTSAKQLLCALRDAIAGHMELYNKGTIHRDVSIHNVLLGKPGAEPGSRGVLIDFDMAIHRDENAPNDWHIGTRLYQSITVLSSGRVPHPLPHDHLNDLESFFYLLVHIVFAYDSTGNSHSPDDMLLRWDSQDLRLAAQSKEAFLTRKYLPEEIEERWPSPCVDLVLAIRVFVQNMIYKKLILNKYTPEVRKGSEKVLASKVVEHYTHILQLFDKAIEALDRPETWRAPNTVSDSSSDESEDTAEDGAPSSFPRPASRIPAPQQTSLKRAANDYPDDQPPAKRSNSPQSSGSRIVPLPRHSRRSPVPSTS
ncbi:hypothetical protein EST38_g4923 [Candolleomyces aberdarensis]|uniref:Fungal-type protein kinase domain-containing protein n=1 Tax=Candolleomyces aberdarensis TaxID=2316362 RepID=A0A4Q2DLD9_9AGAR|nr:hypothetical protein EST38_g4923 [Candolleomyces aberdarensis]